MYTLSENVKKLLKPEDVNFQILTLIVENENVFTFDIIHNTLKLKKDNKVKIISKIYDSKCNLSTYYEMNLDKRGLYDLSFPLLKRTPRIISHVSKLYTKIKKPFKLYVKGFGESIKTVEILISF